MISRNFRSTRLLAPMLALGLAASMAATLVVLPAWLALRAPARRSAA